MHAPCTTAGVTLRNAQTMHALCNAQTMHVPCTPVGVHRHGSHGVVRNPHAHRGKAATLASSTTGISSERPHETRQLGTSKWRFPVNMSPQNTSQQYINACAGLMPQPLVVAAPLQRYPTQSCGCLSLTATLDGLPHVPTHYTPTMNIDSSRPRKKASRSAHSPGNHTKTPSARSIPLSLPRAWNSLGLVGKVYYQPPTHVQAPRCYP